MFRLFLKSLTIKGFKSFAEKTSLDFEPGVTVVVGPNGSGKSNLVDAVAWVLGAQGARSLRGGKMDDVIFAGTAQRQALGKIVESGPIPAVHGVVRWRRKDLVQWLFQEFRVSVDETTVGRELKTLGFAKLSARPRHYAQNELEGEVFKKTSPPRWQRSGRNARPTRTSKSGGPTKPE